MSENTVNQYPEIYTLCLIFDNYFVIDYTLNYKNNQIILSYKFINDLNSLKQQYLKENIDATFIFTKNFYNNHCLNDNLNIKNIEHIFEREKIITNFLNNRIIEFYYKINNHWHDNINCSISYFKDFINT